MSTSDLSGQRQFARNAVVSWTMQIIIFIAGFVVPRQLNDSLGPEFLGVWDLGWITVRYLALSNVNMAAALTRFSSLYMARGDTRMLSSAATAVMVWQLCVAALALVCSAGFAFSVSLWIDFSTPELARQAKNVLLLLGCSLAADMIGSTFRGLIAGVHRWDIQATINATQDVGLAVIMVSILAFGGNLIQLGFAVLGVSVLMAFIRGIVAFRLCPDVKLKLKYWDKKLAFEMLSFGVRGMLVGSAPIIIFQTSAFLLAVYAGPATLAIFNRGTALVRIVDQMVNKITIMVMPMTSGLIGLERHDEAKSLLINAARYSISVTLPMAIFLICFGDTILRIWMGEGYDNWLLTAVLVSGAIIPISQSGTIYVLQGFNAHGRIAAYCLLVTLSSLICFSAVITKYYVWDEISAAVMVGVSWTLGQGLTIPVVLRIQFGVSILSFFYRAVFLPLLYNIPLFIGLFLSRPALADQNWWLMIGAWSAAGIVTAIIYWQWLLPIQTREVIIAKLSSHTFFRKS